jgi:hypothetical protein
LCSRSTEASLDQAQGFGSHLRWSRQLEQLHRVVVGVDEHVAVDVEHDDRLGRVLDERAKTRFALAQRLLVLQSLGHVAHAEHEARGRALIRAAHRDLDGQHAAVAALRLDQLGHGVDERVGHAIGECFEGRPRGLKLRKELGDLVTDQLLRCGIEQAHRSRVGFLDDAVEIHGQDRILDVVEDRVKHHGRFGRDRRLVGRENPHELVTHRRARQGCGYSALEAVLRHGESHSRPAREFTT